MAIRVITLSTLSFAAVATFGIAVGSLVPTVANAVRSLASYVPFANFGQLQAQEPRNGVVKPAAKQGHGKVDGHGPGGGQEEPEGLINMRPEQIEAAEIEVAPVGKGVLAQRLTVPGTIGPDTNRIARIAAKVVGTVSELKKQLGDTVSKGEVVAIIESREVAEAKSEYISAQVNLDLQRTLFEREQALFGKKITAENQFLRARMTFAEAQLRFDLARQKLSALNVGETGLSRQATGLQRYEIRTPIAGRVVERLVDLGAPVGGEGQAKELYVIADLSSVWIELTVSTVDLNQIKEGQRLRISAAGAGKSSEGQVVFISPMLNQETRSARVIASVENEDLTWRPGSYVSAQILVNKQPVDLLVPRSALQTIGGEQVVFVRTPEGFEKREVALGKNDEEAVEVVFGLDPGENVAITNTFVLKAELGKAEAEHAH